MQSARRGRAIPQTALHFRTRGGKRAGAGRKPNGPRAGVAHLPRRIAAGRFPVHVTLRAAPGLASFREGALFAVIEGALAAAPGGRAGETFRVVHFSVQSNHLHLFIEADDAAALRSGAQGLAIRIARAVNTSLGRRGRVWSDRFHAREMRTPREVRAGLVYVLQNARKHGSRWPGRTAFDRFSSARHFARAIAPDSPERAEIPVLAPRTWLARHGWQRAGGAILPGELPRAQLAPIARAGASRFSASA